jgi:carbamoyl-phosphate synthase large subunit
VAGIMEHIEEAGIHSGDSACVLPPHTLSREIMAEIARQTEALARELRVVGLMNIQYAIKDGLAYILEVNPRASRTVPFVSKATGVSLAKIATRLMLGGKLADPAIARALERSAPKHVSVKEAVFPFKRFPGVDILLGPEMLSTGEVMGIGENFESAFMKSQIAAGQRLPDSGKVFLSVNDRDKPAAVEVGRMLADLGFEVLATSGTAGLLKENGVPVQRVFKVHEGRPNVVDLIKNNEIALVINTPSGKHTVRDSRSIRQATLLYEVPYSTTMSGARAMAQAIADARKHPLSVSSLQEYNK